jgi:UDP-3-O-[3-hydroxymyristoyl] glucosamine N-acyltransferase
MKSFTLKELATLTDSILIGDPDKLIRGFSDLNSANGEEISFYAIPLFDKERHRKALEKTKAGALFLSEPIDFPNTLVHKTPTLAFQKVIELFLKESLALTYFEDIHPSAVIHKTAQLGRGVKIGPNSVIDAFVEIGEGTTIGALCSIGPHTKIGKNCTIHPNVTLRERVTLYDRVILQPGVVIGSCGFGYSTDAQGHHTPIKQLGTVVIENDVDIGANTTIDRARFETTRIGEGTKIDNLVQIGHGVILGAHNLMAAQTGVAGSTKTGPHVVLGGQVAVNGHIELCSGVIVTAKSGVSKSIKKPGKYGGIPAVELGEYNKQAVHVRKLPEYVKSLKNLQKKSEGL